ncbi:MAG: SDR family NAD(P)-dependent oxidoreductase [Proteobacteria bacterium]|nr:SDR family NAD(P)-dependent oxidoreductase [Pseudomonadota bacterium]
MSRPFAGRVALVTGASRGIGRSAALALAGAGAHVIAAARTIGALEALDDEIRALGGTATLVPIDLKDLEAVDRFAPAIAQRWSKLDILVGNAGLLGPLSPVAHIEDKTFDDVFRVNVTANFRLLRALDPALRAADAGRVLMITSGAARRVRAFWGAYAASKAALEALVRAYAAETMNITNVRAMLVDPGRMRTAMRAAAMPGEDPESLPHPDSIAPAILKLAAPDWTETGKLYEVSTGEVIAYEQPR